MRGLLLIMCVFLSALAPRAQDGPDGGAAVPIAAWTAAVREGGAGRLRATVEGLVAFGSRHVASATDRDDFGTGAARAYLERRLLEIAAACNGRLTVERQQFTTMSRRLGKEVTLVNLIATLKGTEDPERVYVVGGHYDSINGNNRDPSDPAPGANDDASGTAVVLEACRVLSQAEHRATLVFCCYDGEEMGLLGSQYHAEQLAAADVLVDGMITNDIVGNTLGMDGVRRPDYLRCFSYAPRGNDSFGRSLARAASLAARDHVDGLDVRLVFRGDRYGRGGDHRPFFSAGYPAVRFTEPREDYSRQHQNVVDRDGRPYGDLPEFMDFDYAARVCALNVALLGELANAPRLPARVRVRGARDAYDTLVSFTASPGAVDHEVVWRLTTAADWQEAVAVGAAATQGRRGGLAFRLPGVCLDDVVVGVRAVGAGGARSRVATPPEPDAFSSRSAATGGSSGRRR